jgi:hypothetical protein
MKRSVFALNENHPAFTFQQRHMKQCEYCGKKYADEVNICVIDGTPLHKGDLPPTMPLQSGFSIILFAVLSCFIGIGLAGIAIATIANYMNRTEVGRHVDPIVGGPGDAFVAHSVPILFVGGLLGLVVGFVCKIISEKRKFKARRSGGHNRDS